MMKLFYLFHPFSLFIILWTIFYGVFNTTQGLNIKFSIKQRKLFLNSEYKSYFQQSLQTDFKINPLNDESLINNEPVCVLIGSQSSESCFYTKPFKNKVSWFEVFIHLNEKATWEYLNDKKRPELSQIALKVICLDNLIGVVPKSPVFILIDIKDSQMSIVQPLVKNAKTVAVFDSQPSVFALECYGNYNPHIPSRFKGVVDKFDGIFKTKRKQHKSAYSISQDMWSRKSSDDLLFMIYVLIDIFTDISIKSVQTVTSTEKTGLKELSCMCKNCAKEMIDCFSDESCRKALNCLNSCRGNDQVCSYRCITSYESEKFEKFALCILQRNNCMGNNAVIPSYPNPPPLSSFREVPLTHEVAEGIFIGHLKPRDSIRDTAATLHTQKLLDTLIIQDKMYEYENWSWKVVCGQNPAYDYFGCQHQIFYRDADKPSIVWYDPVFKVTTLAGKEVWRRRHYRVRRGKQPGQFYFSVVDNGVISSEFWRILDCAEDLEWAVFYYSGAASAAGTSYRGALVVSKDGRWPEMTTETSIRIISALEKGGIKMWELFEVSNSNCGSDCSAGPPPLGVR